MRYAIAFIVGYFLGNISFSSIESIVYPMHGAGTIESIEEKEMFGDKSEYYIIKMPIGDMRLMVPTETASEIGVREVSPATVAPSVFAVLEKPKSDIHEDEEEESEEY